MDITEKYLQALSEYRNKNYDNALQILDEIKVAVPNWNKALLLEAYIRRDKKMYLEEIAVLQNITPLQTDKALVAEALSMLASAYRIIGLSEKAVDIFTKSARLENDRKQACIELSNAIFTSNDSDKFRAGHFKELYFEYQQNLSEIVPLPQKEYTHKKIRVGYLSADFRVHPVMCFALPLLTEYDKNNFEVYCYSAGKVVDGLTEQIKNSCDKWNDIVDLTNEDAAKLISEDEIDILFDLSGHTRDNRLPIFAYRPAKVQISGIGYMNSTGLDCVDYFLSDKFCAANEVVMRNFFSEQILKLPRSHISYTPLIKMPEIKDAPCLTKGFVTFGCFNNFSKVTDKMLSVWKIILDNVPNSRLILKHKIFDNDEGKLLVVERLKILGFDLSRVDMRGFTASYLEEYSEVDIGLDTFPYTGGVTTCEALYMGVPVITLYGDRHGTRLGYSMLKNIGLDGLTAATAEEYIAKSIGLATNHEMIAMLHKNLRSLMETSPLMNSQSYVREVEDCFVKILGNH